MQTTRNIVDRKKWKILGRGEGLRNYGHMKVSPNFIQKYGANDLPRFNSQNI